MDDETVLKLLNENFKAVCLEKHMYATMKFMVREASEKVLGKDFNKYKVGVKKQLKIHDETLKQLRMRYGPLVNIKIMSLKKWGWATNLNYIFKTDRGRLYGTFLYEDFFITSHCIERWEERMNHDHYKYFRQFFKKCFYTDATNLDTLLFSIELTHQIGLKMEEPNFRYLSINQGCIVLEILNGICVAKTFLTTDMVQNEKFIVWYANSDNVLKEISDCMAPSEDSREEYDPINDEVPVDFCAKFFKKI
jgi:hypothetical protein